MRSVIPPGVVVGVGARLNASVGPQLYPSSLPEMEQWYTAPSEAQYTQWYIAPSAAHATHGNASIPMPLRPELLPPVVPDAVLQHLYRLAEAMIAGHAMQTDTTALLAAFNHHTAAPATLADIIHADHLSGLVDFVHHAVLPSPPVVADITDTELLEIIVFLQQADGTPPEQHYWLEFLERNVPHPAMVNLIFWRADLVTPESVLAAARAYRPIRV